MNMPISGETVDFISILAGEIVTHNILNWSSEYKVDLWNRVISKFGDNPKEEDLHPVIRAFYNPQTHREFFNSREFAHLIGVQYEEIGKYGDDIRAAAAFYFLRMAPTLPVRSEVM